MDFPVRYVSHNQMVDLDTDTWLEANQQHRSKTLRSLSCAPVEVLSPHEHLQTASWGQHSLVAPGARNGSVVAADSETNTTWNTSEWQNSAPMIQNSTTIVIQFK